MRVSVESSGVVVFQYFRLSFVVTGITLVFIRWMADTPAGYSALKFINKLTVAA